MIEIKSLSGELLASYDVESLREAVEKAVDDGKELTFANLRGANLINADLYGANLRGANLINADLYGANLRGANLRGANLRDANLRGANLYRANLINADLYGANLRDANLRGANLYGAYLSGADFRGADFRGANLRDANLRGANFYGAYLSGAYLSGAVIGESLTDKRYIQIGCIGSCKRITTYCVDDNIVWCGCFTGTLEEFEERVKVTHADNKQYLEEYLGAINYFKQLKDMKL